MSFKSVYKPVLTGTIRSKPEDFIVDEIASFTPAGEGEHLWLHIKKTATNTDWLAGQLAKLLNVKKHDVGFAGLKDRNAVTTQWFSIYLPGKHMPDVKSMLPDDLKGSIEILEQTRHIKKLRRGTLAGNHFTLTIRDCKSDESDKHQLDNLIDQIKKRGIPNYFGEQRFGHPIEVQGNAKWNNIERATAWFNGDIRKPKNRNQRSMYLSAARSWIFNHILSARVDNSTWDRSITGDVFILGNSHSWFVDDGDVQLSQRVKAFDIHPSGALWGKGSLESTDETLALETEISSEHSILCQGLEKQGLKQERRSLRIQVSDLQHRWLDDTSLQLSFTLPPGSYATVLLAQIIHQEL